MTTTRSCRRRWPPDSPPCSPTGCRALRRCAAHRIGTVGHDLRDLPQCNGAVCLLRAAARSQYGYEVTKISHVSTRSPITLDTQAGRVCLTAEHFPAHLTEQQSVSDYRTPP